MMMMMMNTNLQTNIAKWKNYRKCYENIYQHSTETYLQNYCKLLKTINNSKHLLKT